jgi:dolichyl-phosphate-mannose--protein O-mannosyl transferase
MVKRILRGVMKTVTLLAGLVFFFDNRVTVTAGTVLLGSIVVCFLCLFV